jgi:acyl-CoA synthetase (AMP-forming)/AMP-acid ligase II
MACARSAYNRVEDNNLGCADFVLGCAIAGAVRVPLYPRNSAEAHAHMIEGTGCRVVFTDAAFADTVRGLDQKLDCLRYIQVRDESYEDWIAAQDATDPMVQITGEEWYIIRRASAIPTTTGCSIAATGRTCWTG